MDTQDTFVVFFCVFADQSLCLSASFPGTPLCALHFRHHDQTTSLEPAFTNRDVCNSFRMCSYVNCQVSPAQASPFLKSCLNFSVTLHSSPLTHHFSGPFFSCTSALFHFPYPVSPVFVTLTKKPGCIPKIPILEFDTLRSPLSSSLLLFTYLQIAHFLSPLF